MPKTSLLLAAVAALVVTVSAAGAAAPNKCVVNGTVTYQREPCPSEQVRKQPTVQELNAEEKRRRSVAAASAADGVSPQQPTTLGTPAVSTKPATPAPATPRTTTTVPSSYRCDGRKYCSQMTSCAEAKYFLANCPGVKMDGDKNGIPCEQQWCSR
jgi:Excalibur calcium-binding domain